MLSLAELVGAVEIGLSEALSSNSYDISSDCSSTISKRLVRKICAAEELMDTSSASCRGVCPLLFSIFELQYRIRASTMSAKLNILA
jgi:hypothetical protein